jgi:hypothetical protein
MDPRSRIATLALGALGIAAGYAGPVVAQAAGVAGGASAAPSAPAPAVGNAAIASARVQRHDVLNGERVTVTGKLLPAAAGSTVELQSRRGRGWTKVATAHPHGDRYSLGFTPHQLGTLNLRVRLVPAAVSAASAKGAARPAPAVRALGALNVYRLAGASWYGPGGGLACGGTLTDSTRGVAHKTLPCGTLVTLHLGHRTVRVPVIDRGPYVAGRDYDLTPATKRALGFGDTGKIWATR